MHGAGVGARLNSGIVFMLCQVCKFPVHNCVCPVAVNWEGAGTRPGATGQKRSSIKWLTIAGLLAVLVAAILSMDLISHLRAMTG